MLKDPSGSSHSPFCSFRTAPISSPFTLDIRQTPPTRPTLSHPILNLAYYTNEEVTLIVDDVSMTAFVVR